MLREQQQELEGLLRELGKRQQLQREQQEQLEQQLGLHDAQQHKEKEPLGEGDRILSNLFCSPFNFLYFVLTSFFSIYLFEIFIHVSLF